ncbi:MYXO-CTERM sorting domain-containing protein [Streptomyces anulatus]
MAAGKQSHWDLPGYTAFLGVVAFWAAVSSGNEPYVRVLAGISAAAAALHLGSLLFRRRRDRRSAVAAADR